MSRHEPHDSSNKKVKMPLPHYIKTLVTLLVSTFRALVYKLLVEFMTPCPSRCVEFIRARFAVNGNPAQPKSHSQAVEAGRPVLSFRDSFLIFCKFSRFIMNATIGRAH